MSGDKIQLRNSTDVEEFRACVVLQKEVWRFADNELVPLRIFSLAPKIGGQVIGAWEGEALVGFAFSIPGMRNGHIYLHSHMLAVKDGYRRLGLSTDAVASFQFEVIAARRDFAETHTPALIGFVSALADAFRFIRDPAAAKRPLERCECALEVRAFLPPAFRRAHPRRANQSQYARPWS